MRPSKGLVWAQVMAGLMIIECLVLVEVIFFDSQPGTWSQHSYLKFYFLASVITCAVQLIGIGLVQTGHYKWGGILQIGASALHALELEGLIGLIGGMKAYSYPTMLKEKT